MQTHRTRLFSFFQKIYIPHPKSWKLQQRKFMFNYWHNYRYYFKIINRLLSLDKGNAKCFSLKKSAMLNILWKQNVFYFFHQFIGFNPGGNTESLSGPFPSIPTSKGSGTVDWGMSIENLTAWKMNALSFVLSQMNPRQPTYQNRSRGQSWKPELSK